MIGQLEITSSSGVGASPERVDGQRKVQGTARYTVDVEVPGMLHALILRSPYAHARVVKVDKTRAAAVPGVAGVYSGEDVLRLLGSSPWYGSDFRDRAPLVVDKARFIGDPVAAVVAVDLSTAEEALQLIDVEYDELPAVFDAVVAAEAGAPLLHEVIRPSDLSYMTHRSGERTNVCYQFKLRHGDVDRAFAEAAYVFEDTYTVPPIQHGHLEPHAVVAYFDEDEVLNVWDATQTPFYIRSVIASLFGLPLNKVRVRVPFLGGGFGGKVYEKIEPVACFLAVASRRPVKLVTTRSEEFVTTTRHGAVVRFKTGVDRDGKIVARKCTSYLNTGAYAEMGPRIVRKAGFTSCGPYAIPNVWIDSYCVYTNLPPAAAYRGFGVPQPTWAGECQLDDIAAQLGMDPLELRNRNVIHDGEVFATGSPIRDVAVKETMEAIAGALEWGQRTTPSAPHLRRGKGIALSIKAMTSVVSNAAVSMNSDGSVNVITAGVESGQGSQTLHAQIVAEELGVPIEKIRYVLPDTDVSPYDFLSASSRLTFLMGNAIRDAAREIRQQLLETAANLLEANAEDLVMRDGRILVREIPDRSVSIGQVFQRRAGVFGTSIVGNGTCKPKVDQTDPETGKAVRPTAFWDISASGVEVEVDTETGKVRVVKVVGGGDAGRAINPHHCRQQVIGATVMGIAHALWEEMRFDGGQATNASFLEYHIPSHLDCPDEMVPIILEFAQKDGPFGAKGIGESGVLAIAPAVGNAIFDAVGVRIHNLPITPEKVLRALQEQGAMKGVCALW